MARPPKPSEEYASDHPEKELEENARESGVKNADEAVEEYRESEASYGRDDAMDGPDEKKSDKQPD